MVLPDFSFERQMWKKGYGLVIGVDEVGRGSFAGPVVAGAAALKKIKNSRRSGISDRVSILSTRRESSDHDAVNAHSSQTASGQKSKIKNNLESIYKLGINDSKKLSPHKRKELVRGIKKYFYWGIGEASVPEINRLGIVKATAKAMRFAIKELIAKITNYQNPNNKQLLNSKFQNLKQYPFVLVDAFYIKYVRQIGLKNQLPIVRGDEKSISIAAASIVAKVYRDTLMRKLSLVYRKYQWGRNKGYGTEGHRKAILKFGTVRYHRFKYVETWLMNKVQITSTKYQTMINN